MSSIIDTLEESVGSATALISGLRDRIARLERELAAANGALRAATARQPSPSVDPETASELERLRAERVVIRERIRTILKEIDRVIR